MKVGVKQRGCNGLSYTLDYAKEKGKLDEEVVQDGEFHLYIFDFEKSIFIPCEQLHDRNHLFFYVFLGSVVSYFKLMIPDSFIPFFIFSAIGHTN